MSFVIIAFAICGSTYVGMNGKIQDNHKVGFFVALAILGIISLFLG